ncbi:MAG: hypothetical protein M0Z89_00220 [Nitrospiraceae bacterium]|nr:hypothetical protein [Nitrospiraceae bacterium]
MKKKIIATLTVVAMSAAPAATFGGAEHSRCTDGDATCKDFEQFIDAQQPEKIIGQYDPAAKYSDMSLRYIGDAYLQLASRDNVTPEQEEGYYRKALEVKHYVAYMGLYFFYAQKDEDKALGFLREYVKTKPADTVPYVILGESELDKKHYDLADAYLRDGKKVAHAHSPRVDWLLFQANYLLKNYRFARDMFESAVTNGNFENEIKAILADHRFDGIDKLPEFKRYQGMFNKEITGR